MTMLIFYGPHLTLLCYCIQTSQILEPKTEVIFKRKLNDTRTNVHTLMQRETITFILNKLVRVSFDFFML